jgi:excisionase family DNA binding protein
MNGNSDHARIGSVAESEAPKHPTDGRPASGPPRQFPSVDSRGLVLPEKLKGADSGMSRLLTVDEVAALLGVPPRWVYRHAVLKPPEGIPHVKMGKYLRFRESDLRDYIDRLRRQ